MPARWLPSPRVGTVSTCVDVALPRYDGRRGGGRRPRARVPGNWSGAASVVLVDGVFWLAYRVRRPLDEGRGVSVVVARSDDGLHFAPVCESRPGRVRRRLVRAAGAACRCPGVGWRLYLSCATPGSKHWWIEALDADRPEDLRAEPDRRAARRRPRWAVKDPVIVHRPTALASVGLLPPADRAGQEDRMVTRVRDQRRRVGVDRPGTVLTERRGAGTSAVPGSPPCSCRIRSPCSTTGGRRRRELVRADRRCRGASTGAWCRSTDEPVAVSPDGDGALRYVSVVDLPDGRPAVLLRGGPCGRLARPDDLRRLSLGTSLLLYVNTPRDDRQLVDSRAPERAPTRARAPVVERLTEHGLEHRDVVQAALQQRLPLVGRSSGAGRGRRTGVPRGAAGLLARQTSGRSELPAVAPVRITRPRSSVRSRGRRSRASCPAGRCRSGPRRCRGTE